MTSYEVLGLRRVINADSHLTALGGSLMPDPVLRAIAAAATGHVDLFELQARVGERLADLTHNEAAYVSSGAAAGLTLATLACRTGEDLVLIAHLPDGPIRNEVIIHSNHRIPYDWAVVLAGARLVTIGNALQTFGWELEAAIGERTAMVLYVAGQHLNHGVLSLEDTVGIAHARGVPVVVDAAAQLPPPSNLWRFTREVGADLAVFSGGKALRGPQPTGLIVGRADLVRGCAANGPPHQRFARAMKTGKEEIIGLLAAVEHYLSLDHVALDSGYEATVRCWIDRLEGIPGFHPRRDFPNEAGQPIPRLRLDVDGEVAGLNASDLRRRLWDGDPPVAVALADTDGIFVTPDTLEPGEDQIVVKRMLEVIGGLE